MDWRHLHELLAAGRATKLTLKNLCVWVKTNAGMGTFYRSQHELIAAFKLGDGPHINSFELGQHGRRRTNVWTYPGFNAFGTGRDAALAMHPTVKPVALIADAIKDCSKRNGLILDPFLGSGTTVLAAEVTGRRAAGLELDPRYVDCAIRRWQRTTGKVGNPGRDRRELRDRCRRAGRRGQGGGPWLRTMRSATASRRSTRASRRAAPAILKGGHAERPTSSPS